MSDLQRLHDSACLALIEARREIVQLKGKLADAEARYESAVEGRRAFRQAFREAQLKIAHLKEELAKVDAAEARKK